MVYLILVSALAVVAFTFVMGASSLQAQHAANRVQSDRAEYLREAANALAVWYAAHQATLDGTVAPPNSEEVLRGAGIAPRYGLALSASDRLIQDEVAFRVFALWLPAASPDPSRFDPSSGAFAPGPGVPFVVVSGADIQARAVADTRHTMARLAAQLEHYFAARTLASGGDVSANHFRPSNGCAREEGAMPCLDAYTAATSVDWLEAGVGAVQAIDAWGGTLELSNLIEASAEIPPYSMAIRARTPWGTVLQAQAVQRF